LWNYFITVIALQNTKAEYIEFLRVHCVNKLEHKRVVCGKLFAPAGRKSYTGTEVRPLLHEEAGNRLTKKLIRQDATDPKQKAVTDYKEQLDSHTPTPSTGKLKSRRTDTTTTDITTKSPISEQWPQEIAR